MPTRSPSSSLVDHSWIWVGRLPGACSKGCTWWVGGGGSGVPWTCPVFGGCGNGAGGCRVKFLNWWWWLATTWLRCSCSTGWPIFSLVSTTTSPPIWSGLIISRWSPVAASVSFFNSILTISCVSICNEANGIRSCTARLGISIYTQLWNWTFHSTGRSRNWTSWQRKTKGVVPPKTIHWQMRRSSPHCFSMRLCLNTAK